VAKRWGSGGVAAALALTAVLALAPPASLAAGLTVANTGPNLIIRMQDALPGNGGTRVLYDTVPDVTQARAHERCAANFYVLDLRPGLPEATPRLLARDFCGSFGMSGTLLENGDVVLVAGDRVETWRPGAGKVKAWRLSDVAALKGPWKQVNDGTTPLDVARDGTVVLARTYPRARGDTTTASARVAALSADGAPRWRLELAEPGVRLGVMDLWATADGGALLDVNASPMTGSGLPGAEAPKGAVVTGESRLYRISADGTLSKPVVIARQQMPDPSAPVAMPDPTKDPAAFQAAFQAQLALSKGTIYTAAQVAAHPHTDGGVDGTMDVLAGRGTTGARLVQVGRDGTVLRDTTLDAAIAAEGLGRWTDFLADADRVVLYGTVGTRANLLPQGYFGWIGISDGTAVTRLAPLDPRGLEAAKTARDEDRQHLPDDPAQEPLMLTTLGDEPLAVALVTRNHRRAIQLDEGTGALALYTEAKDARRAEAEKAARRAARKADREARHARLNADLAAAAGVSPEEFAAMSSRERKQAMLKQAMRDNGNLDAMMAAAARQAEMARASQTGTRPEPAPDAAQVPSAAEMNAQMAAALARARQTMAARGAQVLVLDADRRGHIEYRSPDGESVTLLVLDRETGRELLKKTYADGAIRESVPFGDYDVPLDRIDVFYRDAAGRTLGHPALVTRAP
jgi:hypothetical protein